MNMRNLAYSIHSTMERKLYNTVPVESKRAKEFLQSFEILNQIVRAVEDNVRKAIRDIKSVLNFKSLPVDLSQAKMSKIISVVKKSLQRGVS
jgi:uncharacterized protein (UPF0147 family)